MNSLCLSCQSNNLSILFDNKYKKSVSSDNKIIKKGFILLQCNNCQHIQKKITLELLSIIENIYQNYSSYYLTGGEEESANCVRSKKILDSIKSIIPEHGNILDIGAGSGVFLEQFIKQFNLWDLFAQDIKNNINDSLVENKQFRRFFSVEQPLPKYYFDIVSAIYVFEHVIEIKQFLDNIKYTLKKNGFLILQVPNIYENLYDIFTIDHVSHFSQNSIYNLMKQYFNYVYIPKEQIYKEIMIIASDISIDINSTYYYQKKNIVFPSIDYLVNMPLSVDKKYAIFGASPAGLFCAFAIDLRIEFFLDENKNKVGKQLYDIDILHPKDINENIDLIILFPYSYDVYKKISNKYKNLIFKYIKNSLD